MEKVFPVSIDPSFRSAPKNVLRGDLSRQEATVEKVVGNGRYLISLKGGGRLTALGPQGLEKGSRVQVEPLPLKEDSNELLERQLAPKSLKSDQWLARFPVRWASGTSEARLEFHIEPGSKSPFAKNEPVIHLVFSMKTAVYGDIQWSVYLRRNEVLARVYIEKADASGSGVSRIITEFEDSLKKKGFSLLAPTVILKRPFKVPSGLQLNLQG